MSSLRQIAAFFACVVLVATMSGAPEGGSRDSVATTCDSVGVAPGPETLLIAEIFEVEDAKNPEDAEGRGHPVGEYAIAVELRVLAPRSASTGPLAGPLRDSFARSEHGATRVLDVRAARGPPLRA